ncbi:MAG: 5-formyltetrahydrofolate cyclo-ligase [Myxococcales bacterium]|nr:MAG: 5-formyltetrahydrofolate cyclo-ligase [Myxococcales bacterium]
MVLKALDLPEDQLRAQVKAQLRARMQSLRDALPLQAGQKRASKIIETLKNTAELKKAKTLAAYLPFGSEIELRPFLEDWLAKGKILFLPRSQLSNHTMSFHRVFSLQALQPGSFDIEEPAGDAPLLEDSSLDVILVPALAVDPTGHRIGYGRGYYDRWFAQSQTTAFRICLVYDFQLIPEAPAHEHDQLVQLVITDTASYRTKLAAK